MRRSVFNSISVCAVICVISSCSSLAGATEYFVCNQSGTGAGTLANPYKMGDLQSSTDPYALGPACSNLQPGDTLTFLGGTYTIVTPTDSWWLHGFIRPARNGTANAPITFRAKPGDTVTVVRNNAAVHDGFAVMGDTGYDYIRFQGFYVRPQARSAFALTGTGSEVVYNDVQGMYWPVNDNYTGVYCDNAESGTVWFNNLHNITNGDGGGFGVMLFSGTNMVIRDNYIHGNDDGIMEKFGANNSTYENNYCVNNLAPGIENSGYAFMGNAIRTGVRSNYTIRNNILVGDVEMFKYSTGGTFHDNLIIDSKESGYSSRNAGVSAGDGSDVYQTSFYNNIVFASTTNPSQFYAYYNPRQTFTTTSPYNSLSYFDYNAYQAAPLYDFGIYSGSTSQPHVTFNLAQIQSYGFELHATVASKSAIFTDTVNYQVKAPYTTAGRYGDCLGPDNPAAILDTTRYGPQALPIPTATADSYTTGQNTQLVVSDPGLLSNDTCSDGWALSAVKLSNPSHGTLTLSSTGGFTYTPTTGYTGQDSFTYQARNAYAESTTTTVTLTISGTSVPTTVNDSYSTSFNTQLVVSAANGVLANDSGSGTLTAIKVTDPSHGSLSLSSDGSFTYTPTTGYSGSDSYTYKAHNSYGDGNTATVTITIGGSVPTAVNDSYSVYANHTLTVAAASGLLINDTGTGTLTAIKVTDPSHGSLSLASDGSFTYTPTTGYTGSDSYTYKAHNSNGDSNTATVSITVNTPGAPTATNDSYSTTMNQQLVVASATGLLLNDTDSTGLSLTASKVSDPSHGTVTVGFPTNGGRAEVVNFGSPRTFRG